MMRTLGAWPTPNSKPSSNNCPKHNKKCPIQSRRSGAFSLVLTQSEKKWPLQSSPRLRPARRSPRQGPQGHHPKNKFLVIARRARFGVDRPGPQQCALGGGDDIHAFFGEPFDGASLVACGHAVGGCFVGDFIEADVCAAHAGQLGVFEVVLLRCDGHRAGGEEQGHR